LQLVQKSIALEQLEQLSEQAKQFVPLLKNPVGQFETHF